MAGSSSVEKTKSSKTTRKRDALIPAKSRRVQSKLANLMPSLDTSAEFRWAACFGSSDTGLPTIGEVPGMARCYAALGYGGDGITFSMLAAQLFQRSIYGARDPETGLFAFR